MYIIPLFFLQVHLWQLNNFLNPSELALVKKDLQHQASVRRFHCSDVIVPDHNEGIALLLDPDYSIDRSSQV